MKKVLLLQELQGVPESLWTVLCEDALLAFEGEFWLVLFLTQLTCIHMASTYDSSEAPRSPGTPTTAATHPTSMSHTTSSCPHGCRWLGRASTFLSAVTTHERSPQWWLFGA
jgi:hypothetical protein